MRAEKSYDKNTYFRWYFNIYLETPAKAHSKHPLNTFNKSLY